VFNSNLVTYLAFVWYWNSKCACRCFFFFNYYFRVGVLLINCSFVLYCHNDGLIELVDRGTRNSFVLSSCTFGYNDLTCEIRLCFVIFKCGIFGLASYMCVDQTHDNTKDFNLPSPKDEFFLTNFSWTQWTQWNIWT
jgi:hypothetical protein